MNRTTWIAVVLLLGSNAAWIASWLGREEPAPPDTRVELERTIDTLREKVASLEAAAPAKDAGPGLVGTGPGEVVPPPPKPEGPEAVNLAEENVKLQEAARLAELRKVQQKALADVKAILAKVMQVKDPALRQEGLDELDAALRGTNQTMVEYALSALHSLRVVGIDKSVFRDTVLDLLRSDSPGVRRSAMYALHATGKKDGDAAFALAGASDEHHLVRMHAVRVLRLYNGGAFEGEAAAALAKLLRDEHDHVRKGTVRGLSGATISGDAERALIELAAQPKDRRDTVQHGLGQLKDKSRAVIDALFSHLGDEDGHVRLHAHQGLQRGIPEAQRPYVAKRYADHLETFVNPKSHTEALRIIASFGDASVVPQLERFADNELVDERVRGYARKAAEILRNK